MSGPDSPHESWKSFETTAWRLLRNTRRDEEGGRAVPSAAQSP